MFKNKNMNKKTCYKVCYNNIVEANNALIGSRKRRSKKGSKGRKETNSYYCNDCKAYHLTSRG